MKLIILMCAVAVVACARVEYQESRWRHSDFPSEDGAYLARVAERISGEGDESSLMIAIIEVGKGGVRPETRVYFGDAGQPFSIIWTGKREVTISVPDMAESSDEVGPVTVKYMRLKPTDK